MDDVLKGNYSLPPIQKEVVGTNPFETKAIERLGGSIAFIERGKAFTWEPPKSDAAGS